MSGAQSFNAVVAAGLVAPHDQDWIVRLRMASGTVVARRVSPSTLSMEAAIQRARHSLGSARAQVVDADAVRYADTRRLVMPAGVEAK